MRVGFMPRLLSRKFRTRMRIAIGIDRPLSSGLRPRDIRRYAACGAVHPHRRKAAPGNGHGLQSLPVTAGAFWRGAQSRLPQEGMGRTKFLLLHLRPAGI